MQITSWPLRGKHSPINAKEIHIPNDDYSDDSSGVLYSGGVEVHVWEDGFLPYSGAFASKRRSGVILLCTSHGCSFLSTGGRCTDCQRSQTFLTDALSARNYLVW